MKLDNYQHRTCTKCRRDYETTDSESKICPLCRSDEKRCEAENDKLSPEQIDNWRKMLSLQIGPVAFMLSAEEIQAIRDNMQKSFDVQRKC